MESGTVFLQKISCALLYMVGVLVLFVGCFLFFCLGLVCLGFFVWSVWGFGGFAQRDGRRISNLLFFLFIFL